MRQKLNVLFLSACLFACTAEQKTEPAIKQNPLLGVQGSDISAEQIGGDFTLINHNNQNVQLSDMRGKVVALVFGYAHCPDVCPTNLLDYASAIKQIGAAKKNVAVWFISVDPKRDTPAVLAGFVPMFDKTFTGLSTTDQSTLEDILKRYKVTVELVPQEKGGYLVDHSAGSYLIDQQGRVRVYEPHGVPASQLAHDIKVLLESNS